MAKVAGGLQLLAVLLFALLLLQQRGTDASPAPSTAGGGDRHISGDAMRADCPNCGPPPIATPGTGTASTAAGDRDISGDAMRADCPNCVPPPPPDAAGGQGTPMRALLANNGGSPSGSGSASSGSAGGGGGGPLTAAATPTMQQQRRALAAAATATGISYDALRADAIPCNVRGGTAGNCRPGKPANKYQRGCTVLQQCARNIN